MNLNALICEKLGVEIGEEFKLSNRNNGTYKFTENGLVVHYSNMKGWLEATGALYGLVNGKLTIVKGDSNA